MGVGSGRWPYPLPEKFLNFRSKNGAFCALLSTDFKVCRLITETVSDHIRKTVTNRLCFPFLRASKARTRNYCDNVGLVRRPTLHYRTVQGIAVDTLKWKDRFKSP